MISSQDSTPCACLPAVLCPCTAYSAPSPGHCCCPPLTTLTHLTRARPSGLLAHMDGPPGWGWHPLGYDIATGNTIDRSYCQTGMSYNYFITTTLGKQHSELNIDILLTSTTCPAPLISGPQATTAFCILVPPSPG